MRSFMRPLHQIFPRGVRPRVIPTAGVVFPGAVWYIPKVPRSEAPMAGSAVPLALTPFLKILAGSFGLVAASEMGDKTQLLAFALATRFKKPWAIMAGILTATLLNHGLASWGGAWVSARVSGTVLRLVLAFTFIGFGAWILIPDKDDGAPRESRWGAYATTTVAFFFAEMGDKTQLATVGLGARYGSFFWVTVGTTLGMLFSDGLAVWLGETFAEKIPLKWVRRVAALLFFIFGLWILFRGVR